MKNLLIALFGLVLIANSATAKATLMYSSPVDADTGDQVVCEAINTGGQTAPLTVTIWDGCAGHIEISYTCTTSLNGPRGCATSYTTSSGDGPFYYCQVDTMGLPKAAVRGNAKVADPVTHVTKQITEAQ